MTSRVLSIRIDSALLERLQRHAARRGMSLQDYVARTLVREDFDERFQCAVERTERLADFGGRRVGQQV
jgi:predicted transcriptional regulator